MTKCFTHYTEERRLERTRNLLARAALIQELRWLGCKNLGNPASPTELALRGRLGILNLEACRLDRGEAPQ